MTGLDWGIVLFALGMGAWGYRLGLIVGALTLAGFAGGAVLGSRIGPELLAEGSASPYAPLSGLLGALVLGAAAAVSLEGLAQVIRARVIRPGASLVAEGLGGAGLLAALALALSWMLGAVALNAPNTGDLRREVQRSAILGALNDALPPSGFLLNALNRIDPGVAIRGPNPNVGPPDSAITNDPDVQRAGAGVVKVTGTACGLGVAGSGWVAAPGLVVTNAHVVAGQDDTEVTARNGSSSDAVAVHFDPKNDLALLRADGLSAPALELSGSPERGASGAVLGFPENGGYRTSAARLGATSTVTTQDAYGRGPISRSITALRGRVLSGNSGGPVVGDDGSVLTTVFAATTSGPAGGYGIPNDIVGSSLTGADGPVDTGPCAA